MRDLGYSPNIAARRLASNSAFAIGLLFGGAPGEYFHQIVLSILRHGVQQGYTLVVADFTPFDPTSRSYVLDLVNRKHFDGLILTPPCDNDRELLLQLERLRVPLVRLTPADSASILPSVCAEDARGAYDMTNHLLELGHRRIGFLQGDPNHRASRERFDGFRRALRAAHIPLDRSLVKRGDFVFEQGLLAGRELLCTRPRPTAVFASNDESAAGVISAAHEAGLRVPADLSVAGFDDFPSARKTFPALTTVRQDMAEISDRATGLLFDLINGRVPSSVHIRVPTTLVVRDSAGVAPARRRP